ncbi:MAG: DegT/DnrJ/EryC1/StrS family aminotransferase [Planctomycetota bacterium]
MQTVPDHTAAETWPIITRDDEAAVLGVLRSGDVSWHPVIGELEDAYRDRLGCRHAIAHCNGTAALHAAFFALDLQPGDEVIVPAATWWSSVSPMLWLGGVPVFADAEPHRLGLDPADVERKITPRTKALVVVHLWGLPAKMTELIDLAKRHSLKIIQDASHAHGATWRGQPCGMLGDIGVFSLQGNKLAPAGEGGIFLTDDDAYAERAALLGDVIRIHQLDTPNQRFAATGFGMKTRIAPLSAALALSQLQRLDATNAERNRNIRSLARRLEPLGFDTFLGPPHVDRVYFEFLIRNQRAKTGIATDTLLEHLQAVGCHARPARYPLLNQQPFFTEGHAAKLARHPLPDYANLRLPFVESTAQDMIALPSFHHATPELLDHYADAFSGIAHPSTAG